MAVSTWQTRYSRWQGSTNHSEIRVTQRIGGVQTLRVASAQFDAVALDHCVREQFLAHLSHACLGI